MKKAIVSSSQNIFYDGKQVDHNDLSLEQEHNDVRVGSTIQNSLGSGIIADQLIEKILYSGSGDNLLALPGATSDPVEGVQLVVSLTNSQAFGQRKVKLLIIGLDFNFNLIYDALSLCNNEVLVTKNHYTNVLLLNANDISGDSEVSLMLGGTLEVKEASSCFLSKDLIADENSVPSLFFRDYYFNTAFSGTLLGYLSAYLPDYNLDQLNLKFSSTDFSRNQKLMRADFTTQLGQKFIAKTNNIQKITLLMSVQNIDNPSDLQWDGDLNVAIYPLQSSVSCITDIVPENKIDYPPTATPLAQMSVNFFTLKDKGILLDTVPQPVDFVFSNTGVAAGKVIKPGEAYIIVVKRTGNNTKADLQFVSSDNFVATRQLSIFTSNGWVNISTESLWYQISSDAAKVTSGQYYNFGQGLVIEKIKYDTSLGSNVDYSFDGLSFANNQIYKAICQSQLEKSDLEENPRTGDNVNSHKKFVPSIKLLAPTEYSAANTSIQNEVLTIGAIQDKNLKYENTDTFMFNMHSWGVIKNKLMLKVVTQGGDSHYDQSVIDLRTMIITNETKSAQISSSSNIPYRVADSKIHKVTVGNYKNSTIDYDDLLVFAIYKDLNFNVAPLTGSSSITYNPNPPYNIIYQPSYQFLTRTSYSYFTATHFILSSSAGITIGSGGQCDVQAISDDTISITNADITFSTYLSGQTNPYLYLNAGSVPDSLRGRYLVISYSGNTAIVKKPFMTSKTWLEALSFDIDGDQIISSNDGYLLNIYLNKTPYTPYTSTYPVLNPYFKINTSFDVIELDLENFVDRHDDYLDSSNVRGQDLHTLPQLYSDTPFTSLNTSLNLVRKLAWSPQEVFCSSDPRLVAQVYPDSQLTDLDTNDTVFPSPLDFEKNVNNYFNPGNFLVDGNLLNKDKTFHKLDFEVSDIILEIPEGLDGYEKSLDVFTTFVYESLSFGNKLTVKGFPALKFSDGTYVQEHALDQDQVRFSAAIQSFTPQLDGTYLGNPAIIVDGRMGMAISDTGILSLNFTNLYNDPAYVSGNTKIKISVFLKKAGFSNRTLKVNKLQVFNLLSS